MAKPTYTIWCRRGYAHCKRAFNNTFLRPPVYYKDEVNKEVGLLYYKAPLLYLLYKFQQQY